MKFFYSDSNDSVDPNYDFLADVPRINRQRTVDDVFAHEILDTPPYDGFLISRVSMDPRLGRARYTQCQRFMAITRGVKSICHADKRKFNLKVMGDCGAYSRIHEEGLQYDISDTVCFYEQYAFDYGLSPDEVITDYNTKWDDSRLLPSTIAAKAEFTIQKAEEFFDECQRLKVSFEPIGVVQSWSPCSASKFAKRLMDYGYAYIALGGMAKRPTIDIYNTVCEVCSILPKDVKLHLLGFARIDKLEMFKGLPIYSFDSSSPLLRSFKDETENYYSSNGRNYPAIRLPSPNENKILSRTMSGELNGDKVRELDAQVMTCIRDYSQHKATIEQVLAIINEHHQYFFGTEYDSDKYRDLLLDRIWEHCPCNVCRQLGVDIVLFRGLNRNKRRGYHNLYVVYNNIRRINHMTSIEVSCIKVKQSINNSIYSFIINGKDINKFATVSRIGRNEDGILQGYQRPEIIEHIAEIREYLNRDNALLPNSIVMAFNEPMSFIPLKRINDYSEIGSLRLPIINNEKVAWIVDGQQRVAALRTINKSCFPVSVIAFESTGNSMEREQFVLINNTKPLPKSLIYELLPSIGNSAPMRLRKRQHAYIIMTKLATYDNSPFFGRILTATSGINPNANIKDISVLKMIEHSYSGGLLQNKQNREKESLSILTNYWNAVKNSYPKAWALPPQKSRLTHGAGIISMGYLMDAIGYMLEGEGKQLSEEEFFNELQFIGKNLPWTQGEWHFSKDHILPWNELQNVSRHIDMLANLLIRKYKLMKAS